LNTRKKPLKVIETEGFKKKADHLGTLPGFSTPNKDKGLPGQMFGVDPSSNSEKSIKERWRKKKKKTRPIDPEKDIIPEPPL
jgi:hypothetical protein